MSLWLYDPFRESNGVQRHRQNNGWNPYREMAELERSLDHFFNASTQQLQLRDHAGQVINDKDGFKYRIDKVKMLLFKLNTKKNMKMNPFNVHSFVG
uniref:Uncharacterized protein n=1 Tax=Panagrolaimus superbus TaxID=310955 RepID=A0A914Z1D0_9BILA